MVTRTGQRSVGRCPTRRTDDILKVVDAGGSGAFIVARVMDDDKVENRDHRNITAATIL